MRGLLSWVVSLSVTTWALAGVEKPTGNLVSSRCVSLARKSGDPDGSLTVVSPDGKNAIVFWPREMSYEVSRSGHNVLGRSALSLSVDGKALEPTAAPRVVRNAVTGRLETPVYKKSCVDLAGNEAEVDFGIWSVRLCARNDGVAYRFETRIPREIEVTDESAVLVLPADTDRCVVNYGMEYGCEESVPVSCAATEVVTDDAHGRRFVYLPFLYSVSGHYVAVTEADVFDYPVLNLRRGKGVGDVVLKSDFAHWPAKEVRTRNGEHWRDRVELESGGRWLEPRGTLGFLVRTQGTRTFPWRTFALGDSASSLPAADIVYALARDSVQSDFSWVRPGKVIWDWWSAWEGLGAEKGCTTAAYRRYVDFAARHGVEYILMDEGWSRQLDIRCFNPAVDVKAVIDYAAERGVGVILWMAWAQVIGQEYRVASEFACMGAKGFKIDFVDRGDAAAERFLWKFAAACAKNRMVIDYHGVHRPTGLSRAYPNVLNYEGVHGLECMKVFAGEDFMDNDVKQFFVRMIAGPMDYTPGAMDNYPLGGYKGTGANPGSLGTRSRQMAMMIAYEAPLQMLCDAPAKYERNEECFRFMSEVPVVWADTVGLAGDPDSFAAVARQAKDGSWYVAALNNKTRRTIEIPVQFLGEGCWRVELFRDAEDSNEHPSHYVRETMRYVSTRNMMPVTMADGGGFAARFCKETEREAER